GLTGLLAGLGVAALAPGAIAQNSEPEQNVQNTVEQNVQNTADPLEGFNTRDDGNDPFSDNSLDPLDIIHRVNRSSGLSTEEYRQRQQQSINTEASSFRQQQLNILGEQPLRLQFEAVPETAEN
ncbi:MAG: hypothetical protein HC873_12265, partial [Leptolyngbyaceae cyanobacterium SL_1_1]|nr:hypothetical protein [Leptolyngbyaceae cyanobacterium SL_1_1]